MRKKIIKLTESDLIKIVKKILNEQDPNLPDDVEPYRSSYQDQYQPTQTPETNSPTQTPQNNVTPQTSKDGWTEIELENEKNSVYSKTLPNYKKFISDLISFVTENELEGKFSKSNKNPNKFKYTYTKRRTGQVEEMEFTIDEFNTYNDFMKEYVRIQDIAEKFQTIE
jgi:hypothetical protein